MGGFGLSLMGILGRFVGMKGKVFVGLWVSDNTRRRLKMACAALDVNQGDVMDLLLQKWLDKPHVHDEVKSLINTTFGEKDEK